MLVHHSMLKIAKEKHHMVKKMKSNTVQRTMEKKVASTMRLRACAVEASL